MRVALPLVVLGLIAAAARFAEPGTQREWSAVVQLGPLSGWRCTQSRTYTYDPRHERPDPSLVAEPPEALAPADVEPFRVEVDLQRGDATVWVFTAGNRDEQRPNRVFVLAPGKLDGISVDRGDEKRTICYSHLAHWQIVGDHALD